MLTDTTIRNAKPRAKPYRLHDTGGLYLEVRPSGGRYWRFKYRFDGKEKRLSLGVYPDVPLKVARQRRDEARSLVASGSDPSAQRQAAKATQQQQAANNFKLVAWEWYRQREATWAVSHASKVIARLENYLFPYLGSRPVAEITAPEVLQVVRRLEQRGTIETAHRVLGLCGQIFRFAIATGRAERDPAADLRGALPPVKKQHMASVTEPAQLGELLRVMHGYSGTPVVAAALKLAPLLLVRPGELRHMKWAEVDLDGALWRFTTSKTGQPHVVPLPRQALTLLQELHPLTGQGKYVFPSQRTRDRAMSENALLGALRRLGIDKEECTPHGFRATGRTLLDEVLSFRPDYIEHQLGHAVRDPNGRAYNRTQHLAERAIMLQCWADYCDALRDGVSPSVAARKARQQYHDWEASRHTTTVVALHSR